MTRIVHLTDLHFGYERKDLVAPLADTIRSVKADLLVVSGDLTHRGRVGQFQTAMTFLRGLDAPFLICPGNHDVPLFNLPLRFLAPFQNWDGGTGVARTAERVVGMVRVVAANTADPWSWRRGILRDTDLDRIRSSAPHGKIGIVACHHPLKEPPGFDRGETSGAAQALPLLPGLGIRVVLAGHLHHWNIGVGISSETPQPLLMVQTGTALCGRADERGHGFSVLDFAEDEVEVTPWKVSAQGPFFQPVLAKRFKDKAGMWHLVE